MNLDRFPRYTEHNPQVPVWCLTPDQPACLHRFFDTCPISPGGRYLAVLQLPFEDRQPEPGDLATVRIVDLQSGESRAVAETAGWEPQMGANLNWGGSDEELFFNDVDTSTWQPFAWKLNPLTGHKQRLEGTVYHASPDGRWLASSNLTTMRRTQPGYGVCIPDEQVPWRIGAPADDGFYLTDTVSGERRLLLSIAELIERADPPVDIPDPDAMEIYGFHSKFNPRGDRLMLSLRWFPTSGEPRINMFSISNESVRFAWMTSSLDGSEVHCAVGPDQWIKGGHHGTWFPDGRRISMNLNIDREEMRLVQVNADGSGLRKMHDSVVGSGHPTVHPDGRHVITDAYCAHWDPLAYGDGTVPLRWIDLQSGEDRHIVRMYTRQACEDGVMRIDPHPAWSRDWRYVVFNGFTGGTRRVYIADLQSLLG